MLISQRQAIGGPLDGRIIRSPAHLEPSFLKDTDWHGIYVLERLSEGVSVYKFLPHREPVDRWAKKRTKSSFQRLTRPFGGRRIQVLVP